MASPTNKQTHGPPITGFNSPNDLQDNNRYTVEKHCPTPNSGTNDMNAAQQASLVSDNSRTIEYSHRQNELLVHSDREFRRPQNASPPPLRGGQIASPAIPTGDSPYRDANGAQTGLIPALDRRDRQDRNAGLMVLLDEQENIREKIEDIEMHAEEELFNESHQEHEDPHFYNGVVCIARSPEGSRREFHIPSRVRLFRNPRNGELILWTEFESSSRAKVQRKLDRQRYGKGIKLVPKYAFGDDNEPELYFRTDDGITGHKYKFVPLKPGIPRTCLQGFQGAVLGLLFEGGYKLASATITRPRGLTAKVDVITEPHIQFWTDSKRQSHESFTYSRSISDSSSNPGRATKDLTYDDLDEVKSRLPCPRMFIYAKLAIPTIFVLFIDDRLILQSPKPFFSSKNPETSLQVVPDKDKAYERLRVLEIPGNPYPAIPLNMEGLHYIDQDGPSFKDVKSLSLNFSSESSRSNFEQRFKYLQEVWDRELEVYRNLKDRMKNPRVGIASKRAKVNKNESRRGLLID